MRTQANSAVTRPWHLSRMWHSVRKKIKTVPIERGKPWDNFHFTPDLSLLEWLGVDLRQLRSRVESHLWLDLTRLKSTSPSRLGTLRVGVAATLLLTLPCDVGVMSMVLDNVFVTASLASDLVLGLDCLTADVSTEGADRKFSVLGCFQRIPYISVSSSPIHIKTK
jgi:hypothetical protein